MATTFGKSSPDDSSDESFRDEDEVKIEPEEAKTSFGCSPDASDEEASGKIAKMREELKTCRQEKQEYMDGWQRAKADYVNLLRRIETGAEASELKGKVGAVETLLPAFDALERAKEHGGIPEGFLAIARQLESAFAALGLEGIGKVGEKFDPAYHDALGQDHAESAEADDTITAVLEKGWRVGDAVIRAAKVRVGHFANGK
jgi:molecular chaperone GrpE